MCLWEAVSSGFSYGGGAFLMPGTVLEASSLKLGPGPARGKQASAVLNVWVIHGPHTEELP